MAKSTPKPSELPSTLKEAEPHAKRLWKKTLESAEDQYGKGERAMRTAWNALKQQYEKKGGTWVRKEGEHPSDPRMKQSSQTAKQKGKGKTFGGVDYEGNTKDELYKRAKKLDIDDRSQMSKEELAEAIARKQR